MYTVHGYPLWFWYIQRGLCQLNADLLPERVWTYILYSYSNKFSITFWPVNKSIAAYNVHCTVHTSVRYKFVTIFSLLIYTTLPRLKYSCSLVTNVFEKVKFRISGSFCVRSGSEVFHLFDSLDPSLIFLRIQLQNNYSMLAQQRLMK